MNQNGQTAASAAATSTTKRNKNRSSGISSNAPSSMSSNVQRTINRSMRNNYPNLRGSDSNMSLSSSSSLHRNIHPSKSSQSMMLSQTSGSNHHSHNHMTNATTVAAEVPCNSGVYKNKRLVHSMTSLIGCLIEVKLKSGERYEGILKTFSSEFQLALCSAALIDNIDEEKRCQPTANSTSNNIGNLLAALEREENVVETLVINAKNLVTFKAVNVDLDFATKKAVMTDSEIAKHDGNAKQHRELVPWDGGDDSIDGHDSLGLDSSLDDHSGLSLGGIGGSGNVSNGWKTEDMFKLNESKYNIETTYQDDMSEYTIKLEHRNDEEYRQREAQAAKIAREIEQDTTRVARYSKEDELDEEARYSAVIRSDPDMTESGSNIASPSSNSYNNNNNNSHHHHYRNDMNHHPSRDQPDRNRDNNLRNSISGDNLGGFRTQNSRQNRSRMNANRNSSGGVVDRSGGGGGGGPSIGPNEPNWRDANNRVSANHRYHQQQSQPPYGSAQNQNKPNSGYVDRKYNAINSQQQQQQQQQPQQTYQPSAASQANNNKSSYSSVSARNIPNDIMATTNEMETIKTFTRSSGQHGQPPSSNDSDNVGYQRKTSSGNNPISLPQRESFKQQQRTPYNRVVEQQQQLQQQQQPHHHQQHQHHSSQQQSHTESKLPSNNKSLESSDISSTKSSLPTSPSSGPSSNISTPTAEPSLMKSQAVTTNSASKPAEIHQSKSNDQNYQPQTRITSPKQGLDVGNNNNRKLVDSSPAGENRPTMVDAVKKGANMNQQQQGKPLITSSKDNVDSNESKNFSSDSKVIQTSSPLSSTGLNSAATTNNSIVTAAVSFTSPVNTATTATTSSFSSTITVQQPSTTASTPSSSVESPEIVVTSKLNPNAKVFTPRAVQMPAATQPQQQNPQQVVAPLPPHNYPSPHAPYPSVATGHMTATTPPSIPSTPSLAGPAGTGQFIPYTHPHSGSGAPGPHLAGHAHHAQQQSIRYPIQFQYNPMMQHQMVPQYITIQHFAPSMAAGGVTATAPSQQSSGGPPNQQPPPPGSSHHMIAANAAQSMATQAGANSLVHNNGHGSQQQQVPPQQSQQPVNQSQPRGHYRGGGKNGPGGNPNANQQSQQIRHQHHEAFVSQQQAQVANVTGPPIMTGATQPQHLPVVFPGHHHHAQNQLHHGQQASQNAAMAAQLAASAQPGHHNQALTHYMYPAGFAPRPLLATHQSHHYHPNASNFQPGLYGAPDSHIPTVYMQTEMPPHQIVTAQSMAPPPNAMVPPPTANIPQTIVPVVPTSGGNGPATTGTQAAVVSATQSSVPQGSVPTSQQQFG